jgi:hypothetical protein
MGNGVHAQSLHVNGISPHTEQHHTNLMTCIPCLKCQYFKQVNKDILHCVSDNPEATYGQLQFSEVNLAGGDWRNLLIRLRRLLVAASDRGFGVSPRMPHELQSAPSPPCGEH